MAKKPSEFTVQINARKIKTLVSALSSSIKDALFQVDSERMYMKALDPSHVSLAVLSLPAESFDLFEVEGEVKMPLSLDELNKYLARARPNDDVTLKHSSSTSKLEMVYAGGGISTKTFQFPLSRLDMEEAPEPPEMEFDVQISTAADFLAELVKDCKVVSPHITLYTEKGKFGAKASESGGTEADFAYSSEGLLSIAVKEDSKAAYTLQYLEDMAKISAAADAMHLQFSSDKPLRITFDLIGGGSVTFLLAPRLEPDFS